MRVHCNVFGNPVTNALQAPRNMLPVNTICTCNQVIKTGDSVDIMFSIVHLTHLVTNGETKSVLRAPPIFHTFKLTSLHFFTMPVKPASSNVRCWYDNMTSYNVR